MPFEAAKRFDEGAIAQGGEAGNAQIDPDPCCRCRMHRCRHLALGLETDVPVTGLPADGAVFDYADNRAGLAKFDPAQLGRQLHPPTVKLAVFGEVDEADAVAVTAFFLKAGAFSGQLGIEKTLPGRVQILQLLLQVIGIGLCQPLCLRLLLPSRDPLGHRLIARHALILSSIGVIAPCQCLVPDKTCMPDQYAQTRILVGGHIETEFETLAYHHKTMIALFTVYNDSTSRLTAAPHSPHTCIGVGTCGFWDGVEHNEHIRRQCTDHRQYSSGTAEPSLACRQRLRQD